VDVETHFAGRWSLLLGSWKRGHAKSELAVAAAPSLAKNADQRSIRCTPDAKTSLLPRPMSTPVHVVWPDDTVTYPELVIARVEKAL